VPSTVAARALLLALVAIACDGSREEAPRPARLSEADYDAWRRPDALIAALGLRPGDTVADIGAGRGVLTGRLAAAVGAHGRVVATDIDAAALAELRRLPPSPGAAPIEIRQVAADRPGLEAGRYDLVLLAEVDHYLADRAGYLRLVAGALAERGRIAVANRLQHRAALLAAARQADLVVVADHSAVLPGQFLVLLAPATGARR
jgi:ubiquinone/menaquinone biosynthesis C-methylase UbiE